MLKSVHVNESHLLSWWEWRKKRLLSHHTEQHLLDAPINVFTEANFYNLKFNGHFKTFLCRKTPAQCSLVMHQINHATVLTSFVGIFRQNKLKHYPFFSQIKAWNLCCANLCNKGFHAHLQQRYMTLLCLWNNIFKNSSFGLTGMPGGKPVALHTALLNEDEHKQK